MSIKREYEPEAPQVPEKDQRKSPHDLEPHEEDLLDEALEESFPSSDPIAVPKR